jgi:hypothetical protein
MACWLGVASRRNRQTPARRSAYVDDDRHFVSCLTGTYRFV